jgi:hypothetical protein
MEHVWRWHERYPVSWAVGVQLLDNGMNYEARPMKLTVVLFKAVQLLLRKLRVFRFLSETRVYWIMVYGSFDPSKFGPLLLVLQTGKSWLQILMLWTGLEKFFIVLIVLPAVLP